MPEHPHPADEPGSDVLDARQRAWRATGDVGALWPGVERAALQAAADDIGQAMALLLQGRTATLGAAEGTDARTLGIAGHVTGVGPLLGHYVEQGRLDVSDPVARVLASHLAHGRRRMALLRAATTPVLGALVDAGIPTSVMKGMHTAHVHFPEPGTRPVADVDVVVRRASLARAEDILRSAGFTKGPTKTRFVSRADEAGPYKVDWLPPGFDGRLRSLELWHERNPWTLELHDGLHFAYLAGHGLSFADAFPFEVVWDGLGAPVHVPGDATLVAILAVHASGELYSSRLLRLVELILVARHAEASGGLDWRAVEAVLERSGLLRFAYPSLALVERLAPGTVAAACLDRARRASTGRARRVTAALTPTSPLLAQGVSLSERLMWASGWRMVARRVLEMFLPPRNASTGTILGVYHVRLRRLVTGAVRWAVPSTKPPGTPGS